MLAKGMWWCECEACTRTQAHTHARTHTHTHSHTHTLTHSKTVHSPLSLSLSPIQVKHIWGFVRSDAAPKPKAKPQPTRPKTQYAGIGSTHPTVHSKDESPQDCEDEEEEDEEEEDEEEEDAAEVMCFAMLAEDAAAFAIVCHRSLLFFFSGSLHVRVLHL